MFSNKVTKYLAIAVPLVLALANFVPSNIFLSVATILAFFSYYASSQGGSPFHGWMRTTAMVSAACLVMAAPVVIFDTFYFFTDPAESLAARVLNSLTTVTPYFTFCISIGYGLFAAVKVAMTAIPKPAKQSK